MTETTAPTAPTADLDLLQTAAGLAHQAGRLAADQFHGDRRRATVTDEDGVTDVERAVEESIRARLAVEAPADGVLGRLGDGEPGRSGRRWVIDPLDGVPFFAGGIPLFTLLLTCEDSHGAVAGVIVMPMQQELLYAGRGRGTRLFAGPDLALERARPSRIARREGDPVTDRVLWPEDVGGVPYKTALLATGRADAVVIAAPPPARWWTPLPLIVREADGLIADAIGDASGRGTLLACARTRHDELRGELFDQ
ncbi:MULTISPECIES: inositol monophosphatase family protein [Actinoalloteichus]|uniref:Inositol monophosphatase/fructose-1,6-bisphosphatase family protein n=1 Tax=Actinoalloteichus fjordicus TaxID=1612552 RepID=A0AAC9PQ02_9PSEU|nr:MULTISPECIES: inositol monophosphatase family protein [Actinoalloteichus]APU12589.1 inositol monophosphatase/fructose-1,6-bisphosphatase family protein [Actinoalloteichus fjordicus]APU18542.1 inositol monophosphatase/fructose-1,6-bisphosphatase family protein [Actinoalloteichus sp. GBA129-24]